ncbi:MAG: hypothetical protein AAFU61_07185 [Pseudomonadota bacterium]
MFGAPPSGGVSRIARGGAAAKIVAFPDELRHDRVGATLLPESGRRERLKRAGSPVPRRSFAADARFDRVADFAAF